MKSITLTIFIFLFAGGAIGAVNYNGSSIKFPDHPSFTSDCTQSPQPHHHSHPLKLHLSRRRHRAEPRPNSIVTSSLRDSVRLQTLHRRLSDKKTNSGSSNYKNHHPSNGQPGGGGGGGGVVVATVESGVGFGSGEYFMDVFVGTPPRHFSMILDTGSDLNWIQCRPCHDCFSQSGPVYDPAASSSFRNLSCSDPRCSLVSHPEPGPPPCGHKQTSSCPYYYWYGDSSNTTGDLAVERFTVNLTTASSRTLEGLVFGCGHWNRGLFRGAAGLLGLGRGPLSFSSQLRSLYGHSSFSYCLVDRDSDANVTSKLVFGTDPDSSPSSPTLNYTSFVETNDDDTFYYVDVKSILVGGDVVAIPQDAFRLSADGVGGTIIDSGTTLSYFVEPAYRAIKAAIMSRVDRVYRVAELEDFPLDVCYNVSGVESVELPDFAIVFGDGSEWNFPVENYFIQIQPQEVVCLAFKNTSASAMNIIGNYQQQNFHILYDTKNSRLGFAPMNCAQL